MRFLLAVLFLFGNGVARHAVAQAPPYVDAAERSSSPHGLPADRPGDWLLAFIDVETAGLVAAR